MQTVSIPGIGLLRLDARALLSLAHECRPAECQARPSCCATYEIAVTPKELEAVLGFCDSASQWAQGLDPEECFEETDDGGLALAADENGACCFAYRRGKNRKALWCSLHTAALAQGIESGRVKPMPCRLWPLALSEDEVPVLSVQEGAFAFPCNRWRSSKAKRLHAGVRGLLASAFGEEAAAEMEAILRS